MLNARAACDCPALRLPIREYLSVPGVYSREFIEVHQPRAPLEANSNVLLHSLRKPGVESVQPSAALGPHPGCRGLRGKIAQPRVLVPGDPAVWSQRGLWREQALLPAPLQLSAAQLCEPTALSQPRPCTDDLV